jgi:UDP-N-acetylmuramoylalanine--D-glutamate ligase
MLTTPTTIAPLLRRPAAIFGGGRSGLAVRELLKRVGAESVLYDERGTDGACTIFEREAAARHALVVFSPGFSPRHQWLATAKSMGAVCLGEIDFASLFWKGKIVAVTGTNGKTTLTEFLTHALTINGESAKATGNIGYPLSRLVLDVDLQAARTTAVCEVSSFQSETMRHFRADATLWTNFAEDHLERHDGLGDYFAAKWRLVEHTQPGAVFLGDSAQTYATCFARELPAQSHVTTQGLPADPGLRGTVFEYYPQRENFELVRAWWCRSGRREECLYAAAQSFHLGRHRLALVRMIAGVGYWNDSKATNFHAVEAALGRFDAPVVLIAGGKGKGGDLGGFVARIAPRVKFAALIGETANELAGHCTQVGVAHVRCSSLDEAVQIASSQATAGGHVLLSPGFASFDMFNGYDHRGEIFEQLVRALADNADKHASIFEQRPQCTQP